MKSGTQNHMKMKRLRRLLNCPLYQAVGMLEMLWLLCSDCCDEGNIGKFSDAEIADYLEWPGDPSELVSRLSESGWIDPDDEHRYVIHDWLEHCPEYIRERVRKRHARGMKARKQTTYDYSKRDKDGHARDKPGHVPPVSENVPPIPNPTQPIQTKPRARPCAGLLQVTVETLHDTLDLMNRVDREASRKKPLVSGSECDRLRVLGAAERAIESGDNPAALFVDTVKNAKWGLISQPQEDRAADRLRAYRANAGINSAATKLASQLKLKSDSGTNDGHEK